MAAITDVTLSSEHNMLPGLTSASSESLPPPPPVGMGLPYEQMGSSNLSTDSLPQPYPPDMSGMGGALPHLSHSALQHRKRRSSKNGMPSIIKKSASTPNVRGQAAADAAAMSLADKRRNKLGYHRTSVACGHCRRRKIRCLLAADDHQGRCSNCIRLKKDCNFFPVDQQPSLGERRSRTGSRAGAGGSSGSSSPSPGLSQSQSFDHVDDFNNYSPAGTTAPHEFAVPGLRNRTASVSSMNKASRMQSHSSGGRPEAPHIHTGVGMSRGYDVAHSADGSSTWTSPFMDQSPASSKPGFEDPSSNFWRLAESPMTPATYSTFAGAPSVAAHHHPETRSAFPTEGSREDVGWPLPSRSMSFGNVEGLSQSYSNHYPFRGDYKSPATSGVYPHPIITSHASSASTMSAPSSAISEPKAMHTGYAAPPTWNAGYMGNNIGELPRKASQSFPAWYGEPGHLAQVDEEAAPHHFEEPMIYYPPAATQTQG